MNVTVYLRQQAGGLVIVGIDRAWPGRVLTTLRRLLAPTRVY